MIWLIVVLVLVALAVIGLAVYWGNKDETVEDEGTEAPPTYGNAKVVRHGVTRNSSGVALADDSGAVYEEDVTDLLLPLLAANSLNTYVDTSQPQDCDTSQTDDDCDTPVADSQPDNVDTGSTLDNLAPVDSTPSPSYDGSSGSSYDSSSSYDSGSSSSYDSGSSSSFDSGGGSDSSSF